MEFVFVALTFLSRKCTFSAQRQTGRNERKHFQAKPSNSSLHFCSSRKYITQQKSATVGLKLKQSRGQSQTWLLYFPVTWPLHEQDVVFNQNTLNISPNLEEVRPIGSLSCNRFCLGKYLNSKQEVQFSPHVLDVYDVNKRDLNLKNQSVTFWLTWSLTPIVEPLYMQVNPFRVCIYIHSKKYWIN